MAVGRAARRSRAPISILRSLADCRAIIESAKSARCAVVIGASFIGLEASAALRARDIEVHVLAPEQRPMERVLGPVGDPCGRVQMQRHGLGIGCRHDKASLGTGDTEQIGPVVTPIPGRGWPRAAPTADAYGHTWAATQHRLAGFSEGQNVATQYRWAGPGDTRAALRWKRDGHSSSVRARKMS